MQVIKEKKCVEKVNVKRCYINNTTWVRVREAAEGKTNSQAAGVAAAGMPGYGGIIPVAGKKE